MFVIYHEAGTVIAVHELGSEPEAGYAGASRVTVPDLLKLQDDPDGGPQTLSSTAPTAEDVRAEAGRRMRLLLGARDGKHLDLIIANGTREAVRLQNIRLGETIDASGQPIAARDWTDIETARASELSVVDAMVEAIRAASNALEEADPVPGDYGDDVRWPGLV